MHIIKSHEQRLAILIQQQDYQKGLSFFSETEDYVQVGVWSYDQGKHLRAHKHNFVPREITRTQEVIHVLQGAVKASIYSEDNEFIEAHVLTPQDTLILLRGGHGYEILADNTVVLEVKNGPYLGAEKDRTRLAGAEKNESNV